MYLVGSRAMNEYTPQTWKDTDIVCSKEELAGLDLEFGPNGQIKKDGVEFIDVELLNNKDVIKNHDLIINTSLGPLMVGIPGVAYLYAIKRSHAHRALSFAKTIIHLHKLKDLLLLPLSARCERFLKDRTELTKEKWGDRTPSLNKTNEDFFDDYVKKEYVHDDIHKVVAFGNVPVYEKMKRDFSVAKCERDMWDKLEHFEKIQCVQEEAMVIALERFMIPKGMETVNGNGKHSFYKALEKVCTTLTGGFFRDFAIDNWPEVCQNVPNYIEMFKWAILEGRIEKIKTGLDTRLNMG